MSLTGCRWWFDSPLVGLGQDKNLHPSELNLGIARDRDIWFPSCTFIAGDSALHGGDFIETLRIDFAGDCVM